MTAKVAAELSFDTKKAEASMKRFGDFAESSLTEINSGLELVGKAWGAITGAIGAGVEVVSKWTAAAMDAEKTQQLLARSLGTNYDRIAEFNDALSKKLGIDDDDIASMQQKLLAQGVQTKSLEDATKATLGLSAATGKDLDAATRKVAKAFTSSATEAKRLTELYVLAETQAGTFEGRMRALDTAAGGLAETLGFTVTRSGALAQATTALTTTVQEFTSFLDSDAGRRLVDEFFVAIAQGASTSLQALIGMVQIGREIRREFNSAFGPGFTTEEIAENDWLTQLQNLADRLALVAGGTSGGAPSTGAGLDTEKDTDGKPKKKHEARQMMSLDGIAAPFDAPWARGMLTDADLEREQKTIEAREKMLDEQDAARLARLNAEIEEHDFFAKLKEDRRQTELAREQAFYDQLGTIGQSGVANFFTNTITEWASGEATLAEAAGRAFFGMLSQIGSGLVALGGAAIAAGVLGSVAPIFAPATGGPAGILAGIGLIAAGGTLMALGGVGSRAMGGGASRGAVPTSTAGSGFASSEPRGFTGMSSQAAPQTTVINVNLGRGYMTGTPRELGREIRDLIKQAGSLEPGWAR